MSKPDPRGVAAHYDAVTAAWEYLLGADLHYGDFASPDQPLAEATARLTVRMAEAADLSPDLHVVDVGCGIGTPAITLAKTYGCRVTGITISDVGIARGRAAAQEQGLADRVEFRWADAMDNQLPGEAYDRAWVMESSHLMNDKAALLTDTARTLRPGSRLVLCDIIAHAPFSTAEIMKHAKQFLLLDRVFGRARMEPFAEYDRLASAAGMKVTETVDLTAATLPTFAAWRANADQHAQQVIDLIGEKALADFIDSSQVLEDFWNAGRLGYGLLIAEKP